MKSIFSLLTRTACVAVALGLLLASTASAATILVDDDFESYALSAQVEGLGPQPAGNADYLWHGNNPHPVSTGTDTIESGTVTGGSGSQVANLNAAAGGTDDPFIQRRFDDQAIGGTTGSLQFSFDIRFHQLSGFPTNTIMLGEGQSTTPGNINYAKVSSSKTAIQMKMRQNNTTGNSRGFHVFGAGLAAADRPVLDDIIEDDWYNVVFDIDLDGKTYDVSIDNLDSAVVGQVGSKTGIAFLSTGGSFTKVNALSFLTASFAGAAGAGNYDIDNVFLGPATTIPEPTSLGLVLLGSATLLLRRKS